MQEVLRVHDDRCCENGHQALCSTTGTELTSVPNGEMHFIIFQPCLKRERKRDRSHMEMAHKTILAFKLFTVP